MHDLVGAGVRDEGGELPLEVRALLAREPRERAIPGRLVSVAALAGGDLLRGNTLFVDLLADLGELPLEVRALLAREPRERAIPGRLVSVAALAGGDLLRGNTLFVDLLA